MTTTETVKPAEQTDARLVSDSLAGSREAFRQIVERYQTLICSLAYSSTGNVSQSEDVAQETFLAAWKNLSSLREPEKLRGWLCGIVRHRVHRSRRSDVHEPVHLAAPLEAAHDAPATDALPSEQTISREEEAILWRSLEQIPELYREHQSIERVAVVLELSEDAVKQRLSRGRKLLQEEVQAFVEKTLRRTAPHQSFSSAVLAAVPAGPAATLGAGTLGKGATAGKASFLGVALLPFIGALAGFAAQWLVIDATTPDRKLRAAKIRRLAWAWISMLGAAVGGEFAVHAVARQLEWSDRIHFAAIAVFWWLYITSVVTGIILVMRRQAAMVKSDAAPGPGISSRVFVGIIAGIYLSLGSWLIRLAWLAQDRTTIGVIGAALLVLGAWQFFHVRSRTGSAAARASLGHVALAMGVILAIFNWQFEVWVAAAQGVSLAEVRQLRPLWLIPALTVVFAVWTAIVIGFTRPRGPAR